MNDYYESVLFRELKTLKHDQYSAIHEQMTLINWFFFSESKTQSATSVVRILNSWLLWSGSS